MAAVEKLNIALPSEFVKDIRKVIKAGEYASTSEAIRDALRTWKQIRNDRAAAIKELQRLWREGATSGESVPLDPSRTWSWVRYQVRERRSA